MFIYIIRHAYAYQHGDSRWPDDSKRPLEAEGAARFKRGVKQLAKRGFQPEVIATSPYLRCRETADIVAAHAGGKPDVVELAALTPGGDFEELVEWSRTQEADSIAWVGHAPDVNRLAAALVADGDANIRLSKGAVVAVRIHGELTEASGELHWLVTLKMLGV